jgi:hypothetical protein
LGFVGSEFWILGFGFGVQQRAPHGRLRDQCCGRALRCIELLCFRVTLQTEVLSALGAERSWAAGWVRGERDVGNEMVDGGQGLLGVRGPEGHGRMKLCCSGACLSRSTRHMEASQMAALLQGSTSSSSTISGNGTGLLRSDALTAPGACCLSTLSMPPSLPPASAAPRCSAITLTLPHTRRLPSQHCKLHTAHASCFSLPRGDASALLPGLRTWRTGGERRGTRERRGRGGGEGEETGC